MVKKGSERSKKFEAKYDLNALMLRWKALRNFSLERFYLTPEKHFELDDELRVLIDRYLLPFGKAGKFMDRVKTLVYQWDMLSDEQKQLYREQWVKDGFPVELYDKIAEWSYILSNKVSIYVKDNMVLWHFAELDPKPQEAYAPKEEDYTQIMETETEQPSPKPQDYWFQHGMSRGVNIYFLGSNFKGRDAQFNDFPLTIQTCRADLGIDIILSLPIFERELPEYYIIQTINSMLYEIEIPIEEIVKILALIDPVLAYGINEYDLWLYQLIKDSIKSLTGKTTSASIQAPTYLAIALNPVSAILTSLNAQVQTARSDEPQILIQTAPNLSYVVEI